MPSLFAGQNQEYRQNDIKAQKLKRISALIFPLISHYFKKDNIKALELFTKACGMNLKEACKAYDNLRGLVY